MSSSLTGGPSIIGVSSDSTKGRGSIRTTNQNARRNRRQASSASGLSPVTVLGAVVVSVTSFFAGTLWTMHAGLDSCGRTSSDSLPIHNHNHDEQVEALVQQRILELKQSLPDCQQHVRRDEQSNPKQENPSSSLFPASTARYAVGMSTVDKMDFVQHLDLGVPVDIPHQPGDQDVLVLYSRRQAMPTDYAPMGHLPMTDAVQNCDYLNVILTDHSAGRNQCLAIVPQYESYHIQKWMRVQPHHQLDNKYPLKLVSRGMKANGVNEFDPPSEKDTQQHWQMLKEYIANYEQTLKDLKQVIDSQMKLDAYPNTIIVLVCNFGQSELLTNFVCAAQSRNISLNQVLVFATDAETQQLAKQLGLAVFYDARNFASMPSEAAGHYGDRKFTAMMMAKVICVQLVSALHYHVLFQDVDIVWYKHPLEYFKEANKSPDDFDLWFQDDGGHTVRYAPYSANSGFYYAHHNVRTQYFFTSLLQGAGDLILKTDSHQQALIAVLAEQASLFGLSVKVWSRDDPEFPGGYQYHQRSGKYLKALFAGQVHPYLFHMSWTKNKDNKLLFFRQMGEWYVQDQCIQNKEILGTEDKASNLVPTCCSATPLISCHYRDKPSIHPCKDSPPIDAGKPSFW